MEKKNLAQDVTISGKKRRNSPFGKIYTVSIHRILPNPAQPRRSFDEDSLASLAESIRLHGVLQPLAVRYADELPKNARLFGFGRKGEPVFELIAGERRLRAAKLAGLKEVPCLLIEADDRRSAELALTENLQREDLNLFEQAGAIASLIDIYGLTQAEAARSLGMSQSAVANKLRLLRLSSAERRIILENGLSERHARAVLKLTDPRQRLILLREAAKRSLNVSRLEDLVDRIVCPLPEEPQDIPKPRIAVKDIRIVFNTLSRAVDTIERAGIAVAQEKREVGDAVEFVIRIPKQAEPPCTALVPAEEASAG